MDQYIVIAQLREGSKTKYENHRILKIDGQTDIEQQIPPDHKKLFGPAGLDECVTYVKEASGNGQNWFGLTVAQYALIGVVTIVFVTVVIVGALKLYALDPDPPLNLIATADDAARIFITFMVAVATVAVAFLTILTAMVIREFKERFALAKEVLTLLVGILGTIVGFYFGTAGNPKPPGSPTPTPTPIPTSTTRPAPTSTTTPIPNASPTVGVLRGQSKNDIALAYQQGGKWSIRML